VVETSGSAITAVSAGDPTDNALNLIANIAKADSATTDSKATPKRVTILFDRRSGDGDAVASELASAFAIDSTVGTTSVSVVAGIYYLLYMKTKWISSSVTAAGPGNQLEISFSTYVASSEQRRQAAAAQEWLARPG
jgi:hypothetical protein